MKIAHHRLKQSCYRIRSVHGETQKKNSAPPPATYPICSSIWVRNVQSVWLCTAIWGQSFCSKWDGNHGPTNARLYHMAGGGKTGAWSSRTNDKLQWIKVDLGEVERVTKVASQGRSDYAQWVTRYKVSYSAFGKEFKPQDHVSYRVMFVRSIACFNCRLFLLTLILTMTTTMIITDI